jgi:multiple sugar transport system substrate-binding protein
VGDHDLETSGRGRDARRRSARWWVRLSGSALALAILAGLLVGLPGCGDDRPALTPDGRVIVRYWEKWTGFEAEAMRAVVDDFNASQERIFVKMLSVSGVDQKLLLSTAGGNPPDVAGVWTHTVPVFAEKGALTPLDGYLRDAGITQDDYIPAIWEGCRHRGFSWALPSTPASVALHWNKRLFEEAGLDPDKPPTTIAELDAMAEQLTIVELKRNGETVRVRFPQLTQAERRARDFRIVQLGHSPKVPGIFVEMWGCWFGGELWDGDGRVTAAEEKNIEAFNWFAGYSKKYGRRNLDTFGASFGNAASPQDPFLSGQVAMVLQGVWMYNFIDQFAPGMRWGAAAFPSALPEGSADVTLIEADVLVIPRGARHPDEAFEFIRYVNAQGPMEKLCLGQRKFSPLIRVSDSFVSKHPNPAIRVFMDLARSPNAAMVPRLSIWNEYKDELLAAADRIYAGDATAREALGDAQTRAQRRLDRVLRRWDLVKDDRLQEWGG